MLGVGESEGEPERVDADFEAAESGCDSERVVGRLADVIVHDIVGGRRQQHLALILARPGHSCICQIEGEPVSASRSDARLSGERKPRQRDLGHGVGHNDELADGKRDGRVRNVVHTPIPGRRRSRSLGETGVWGEREGEKWEDGT